jgi:hypothetical protein
MVQRGGQVSTEFIILFSLLIMILVPMIYLVLQAALDSSEQITSSRVNAVFSEVASEAREVYFRGPHSKIIVSADIPRHIKSVEILKAESTHDTTDTRYFFLITFFAERKEHTSIIPLEVPVLIPETGGTSTVQCVADYDCNVFKLDGFEGAGLKHIQIMNAYDDGGDLKVNFSLVRVILSEP